MAERQIDPSRLQGEALQRWYLRSPHDLEQERQAAAAQRHDDFFRGTSSADIDPGISRRPASPIHDVDPGIRLDPGTSRIDIDTGISWVPAGANRWRKQQAAAATQLTPLSRLSGAGATGVAAQSQPLTGGFRSPLDMAQDALHDFQSGPKIPRPNLAESFIPIVGPAWEAAGDLQDRNYGGAAFNAAMAVGDALPAGAIFKGTKALSRGIGIWKDGAVTAGAAAKKIRAAGLASKGEEIHHTVPLDGLGRSVEDWRNHYAFLKTLPQDIHRRLRGSWQGQPRLNPVMRAWHGKTDWQKTVPAALGSYAADAWENFPGLLGLRSPTNSLGLPGGTQRLAVVGPCAPLVTNSHPPIPKSTPKHIVRFVFCSNI